MEFNLFERQIGKLPIKKKAYYYALGNIYLDFSQNRLRDSWEFEMDNVFYLVVLDYYNLVEGKGSFTIQF